jgi:hypothetical protein
MIQIKIDCVENLDDCPVFTFDDLKSAIPFIETCFKNGYDIFLRKTGD